MTVSTTSAAVHITPVVFKTFYKHVKTKGRKLKKGDPQVTATDDVFFDEAFHIVKAFIELGTLNTVESLQAFTNTHVPAPYWAAVSPVLIPLLSCNKAADLLIDWFGPEDLKMVVGGERWWQVRGLDGLDAEWITEKEYLNENAKVDKKLSAIDANIVKMDHLEPVMLYVHGGAYFWGSINTHRYQIIRFAHKIKGRAFAVNYRKAPQYPWPCPLQDVLAAYMYLIDPPPGALHSPISPSKIVFAGDSAGAGLCLTALTVLRDMGVQLPGGAVLISPWVDMTHSFPSVMDNTPTDIIPPHGFIHKPSPIWPVQLVAEGKEARVAPTGTNPPPEPGHADTLCPDKDRLDEQVDQRMEKSAEEGRIQSQQSLVHTDELKDDNVKTQGEMLKESQGGVDTPCSSKDADSPSGEHDTIRVNGTPNDDPNRKDAESFWEPKPPKVLMKDDSAEPLELRGQIQHYATNEQLTHPLVSPVLQSSLGNLCPLYIIAGDSEVLRDEIVYVAHKAANPSQYPTRPGVLNQGRRQKENAERFTKPTKVHLQVFDDMCHVLTVFMFTPSAKYAYRSIAEFVKHVTSHSAEHLERNPFPELHVPPAEINDPAINEDERKEQLNKQSKATLADMFKPENIPSSSGESSGNSSDRSDVQLYRQNEEVAKEEVREGETEKQEDVKSPEPKSGPEASHSETEPRLLHDEKKSNGDSTSRKSGQQDIPGVVMVRERVNIFGEVRSLEPPEEIAALHLPAREIGLIKEDPVKRWHTGQDLWDKKFKRKAVQVARKRENYDKKYHTIIQRARENGLQLHRDPSRHTLHRRASTFSFSSQGDIMADRRWGPLDLDDERPPPTAIAGRRDNRESIALIKKAIYYSAPVTHKTVPKRGAGEVVRAAFDAEDNIDRAPNQSVSEEQKPANIFPIHGLRMWQGILNYFVRKSTVKAAHGKKHVTDGVRAMTSEPLSSGSNSS